MSWVSLRRCNPAVPHLAPTCGSQAVALLCGIPLHSSRLSSRLSIRLQYRWLVCNQFVLRKRLTPTAISSRYALPPSRSDHETRDVTSSISTPTLTSERAKGFVLHPRETPGHKRLLNPTSVLRSITDPYNLGTMLNQPDHRLGVTAAWAGSGS